MMTVLKLVTLFTFVFTWNYAFADSLQELIKQSSLKQKIDNTTIHVNPDGSYLEEKIQQFEVLSEIGRTFLSLYPIILDGNSSEIIQVEYSINNGTFKKATVVIEKLAMNSPDLSNIMSAKVKVDQLRLKDKLTFKIQSSTKPRLPGIFEHAIGLGNETLSTEEITKIHSPKEISYLHVDYDKAAEVTLQKNNNEYILTYQPSKLAYQYEGKRNFTSALYMSTNNSWITLNKYFSEFYNNEIQKPLPIRFMAFVIKAKKMKSAAEQMEYLAQELSHSIAYSGEWTSISKALFPKGHTVTLNEGKGDCKDFSTIYSALLRQLGFEAYTALTFRRTRDSANEITMHELAKHPNTLHFNHVVVWAKDKSGKTYYIDPTNPVVNSDVIMDDILGNFALVLDGKSDISWIPNKNSAPSSMKMTQTLDIRTDNSTFMNVKIEMSPSELNTMNIIKRSAGIDSYNKVLSLLSNPASQGEISEYKDIKNQIQFNLISNKLIKESRGQKAITVPATLLVKLASSNLKNGKILGNTSDHTFETRILNHQIQDSYKYECTLLTRWADFSRRISIENKDTIIRDSLKIKTFSMPRDPDIYSKTKFTTPEDTEVAELRHLVSESTHCLLNSEIVISADKNSLSITDLDFEKKMGPPIEKMTDSDADNLEKLQFQSVSQNKRRQYAEYKLKSNPKDYHASTHLAYSILNLGYYAGKNYYPEYLNSSLKILNDALNLQPGQINEFLLTELTSLSIIKKDQNQTLLYFNKLYNNYKNSYSTYIMASRVNKFLNKPVEAEKWMLSAQEKATTPELKEKWLRSVASFMDSINKNKEAISYYESYFKSYPKNITPWDMHNLALIYFDLSNWDKTIELEKKALADLNFGAAEDTLARAYVNKVIEIMKVDGIALSQGRMPASIPDVEKYLLEAIKLNTKSEYAYLQLAHIHWEKYLQKNDRSYLTSGEKYLLKALEIAPDYKTAQELMTRFKSAKK